MINDNNISGKQKDMWLEKCGIPERYKDSTFDNYEVTSPEQMKTLTMVSEKLSDTILCGGVGTGKTHLACAKINQVIEKGFRAVYVEMIKMIREIKQSWRDQRVSETSIIQKYGKDIPFLVIDEIGVQFGSDTEKQYLTEIINDRYNNKRKTFLITNLNTEGLTGLVGERVTDRFRESKKLIICNWKSYRVNGGGINEKNCDV